MGTLIALPGVRERRDDGLPEFPAETLGRPVVTFGSVGQFAPLWQLPPAMRRAALAVGKTEQDVHDLRVGNLVAAIFFPDTTLGRVTLPILVTAVNAKPEDYADNVLFAMSMSYLTVEYQYQKGALCWPRFWIPSASFKQMHEELSVPVGKTGDTCMRRRWAQLCTGGQADYASLAGMVQKISAISFERGGGGRVCSTNPTKQVIEEVAMPVSVHFRIPTDQFITILGD